MAKATKVERSYGLDAEKLAELKKAKAFNPFREGSSYHTVVNALHSLGMGRFHSVDALVAEYVKQADKTALEDFKSREKRNENGLDWKSKVVQNAIVVGRQKDYGLKLVQLGFTVQKDGDTFGLVKFDGKAQPAKKATVKAKSQPKASKAPEAKPAPKKAKVAKADPTVCGRCEQPLKMFKDKGETEAKLTCPDCGWRHGDRKGIVSPKQIALAASVTKAK